MRDAHGGVGGVHRLTTGAGRPVHVDLEIVRVDLDVDLVGLGEDRHGCRARVDATLALGLGHTLHAVRPAFVLEPAPRLGALHDERDVAEPAVVGRLARQHLGLEPAALGVVLVHAVEVAGPEVRLLAALGALDLDDHVAALVRVAGQEQLLDAAFELAHLVLLRRRSRPAGTRASRRRSRRLGAPGPRRGLRPRRSRRARRRRPASAPRSGGPRRCDARRSPEAWMPGSSASSRSSSEASSPSCSNMAVRVTGDPPPTRRYPPASGPDPEVAATGRRAFCPQAAPGAGRYESQGGVERLDARDGTSMDVRIERQTRGIVHAIPRPAAPDRHAACRAAAATDVARDRPCSMQTATASSRTGASRTAATPSPTSTRRPAARRSRRDTKSHHGHDAIATRPPGADHGGAHATTAAPRPPRPRRVPARRHGRRPARERASGRRARTGSPRHRHRSCPKPRPRRPYASTAS